MKIESATISRRSIPLATPFVTALRRVEAVEFIELRMKTDNGLVALGSAPATKAITGETLQSIAQTLDDHILPALLGHHFELESLSQSVRTCVARNTSAKACAEMALYSLAAQRSGQPLYRLLGAKSTPTLTTAVTVSLDSPKAMLAQAKVFYKQGFDILKIKVGAADGKDSDRISAIASAVHSATLLIDANQAWEPNETLHILDACQDLAIALVEQPVAAADLKGLKYVTEHSQFPILADEAVFTAEDARRVLGENAADLVNIKLMKCGGLGGALDILDVCRHYGKQCMLGSMLEGPVSITAALHLAAAHPDMFEYLDLDSPLLYAALPPDLPFTVQGNTYAL